MDVTTYLSFHVNLSDREWRSITKGLALLAGIKVTVSPEERTAAAELNTAMLEQRARILAEQLRVAQGAVDKAKEAEAADYLAGKLGTSHAMANDVLRAASARDDFKGKE